MSQTELLSEAVRRHAEANLSAAAVLYRQVLVLEPSQADALNLLGLLDSGIEQSDVALSRIRRSLAVAPAEASFLHNLGLALIERSELGDAGMAQRSAVALQPDLAEAVFDLGNVLMRSGDHANALTAYRRALALAPDHVLAHHNLGWDLLTLGRLDEGWAEYAWRWRMPSFAALRGSLRGKPWTGATATGRLLLYAEQGLGDTLQFCRFAALAAERIPEVVLEVQPELVRLLRRSYPSIDVRPRAPDLTMAGARPPHDWHAALLDLPRLFKTNLATIPDRVPYLTPDPAAVDKWRSRLAETGDALRVGLVWAGGARTDQPQMAAVDRRRSLALKRLGAFARIDGVRFISLQKGPPAAEALHPPDGLCLLDLSSEIEDFDDTAAIVSGLDLVITVDTAVAHLAGGLGKPVWLLSRFDGCWRWLTDRADSPWYPTLRIYRQDAPSEWGPAIERVARDLAGLAATKGRA